VGGPCVDSFLDEVAFGPGAQQSAGAAGEKFGQCRFTESAQQDPPAKP
jgi:hypothetical protein